MYVMELGISSGSRIVGEKGRLDSSTDRGARMECPMECHKECEHTVGPLKMGCLTETSEITGYKRK